MGRRNGDSRRPTVQAEVFRNGIRKRKLRLLLRHILQPVQLPVAAQRDEHVVLMNRDARKPGRGRRVAPGFSVRPVNAHDNRSRPLTDIGLLQLPADQRRPPGNVKLLEPHCRVALAHDDVEKVHDRRPQKHRRDSPPCQLIG